MKKQTSTKPANPLIPSKQQVQSFSHTKGKQLIDQIFGKTISLKLLQLLQTRMQPHHKYFNILEISQFIDQYIENYLIDRKPSVKHLKEEQTDIRMTMPMPLALKLTKKLSENIQTQTSFKLQKSQSLQCLMEQLKSIFIFYGKTLLNYQLINQFIYNQQLIILSNREKDEEYMQIGEKRIRIDQNLKLCVMPLSGEGEDGKNTKIKQLVFKQRQTGNQLESIYAVTKDYVRQVKIKPQLIGIAADFDPTGKHPEGCWYYYQNQLIKPKKTTINVQFKQEENVALTSAELKDIRATNATNLDQIFSSHLLNLLKVSVGLNMVGMICLDQSFIIQPLGADRSKVNQGYIGNLIRDVPSQILYTGQCKDKYKEILLFHNYNDKEWLIVTDQFLYFYQVPSPSQNIILSNQNNVHKVTKTSLNPLLLLCQRVPKGCIKAIVLNRFFIALMLQKNTVLIIKLIIKSRGIFQNKQLNISQNYFKITNKIYNDIQFKCMTFNSNFNNLFLSDFGAYLIKMNFNETYGDIEEQGITYNREQNKQINHQFLQNSYNQLKMSRFKSNNQVIREVDEQTDEQNIQAEQYIHVQYIKKDKAQKNHILSIYKKQNKSPHTVIVKNHTRQIITLITTNPHYNSLITYESETYQKKNGSEFQGQKYREWGNKNKIKVWDIRHMTIYQTFQVSIEVSFLELRANGLFAVTTEKGYLGFYPFNEDKKILIGQSEQKVLDKQSKQVMQQLSDDILLQNNVLYFYSTISTFNKFNNTKINTTNLYSLNLQKYPTSNHLQSLPSEINSLAVSNRIYILQNSSVGVEACQVHIYNKMGLKQEMMVFSNKDDIDVATGKIRGQNYNQEYKFLKKIGHQQFNVVLWNADSLKLIGSSPGESFTVVFSSPKMGQLIDGVEKIKNIRNIEVNNNLMIVYCQNTTKIKDKASSVSAQSKNALNSQRKSTSRKHKSTGKYYQHIDYSIVLINNHTDRITYKLQKINKRIRVLHLFNSLLLTRQQDIDDSSYDIIRVMDINQSGDLINKFLFSIKFQRNWTKKLKAKDLSEQAFYELNPQSNKLLQEIKQFTIRKHIILQQSKIAVSDTNKLIIILVFKVQTYYVDILTAKVIKTQIQFMVYVRNISDELLNMNYKISKLQIGKKSKKNTYEYQTQVGRTQNIIGHKKLTIDELYGISNYSEVDMEKLCELMTEEGKNIHTVDITDKILSPKNINTDRKKDIYQILSLKKDEKLFQIFQKETNKANVINNFSFQILEFNQDQLNGVVGISNKVMQTISLYTFKVQCYKQAAGIQSGDGENQPYRLFMALDKIALLQVKTQTEMKQIQELKKSNKNIISNQKSDPVQLLEWNGNYKSSIDKMWEETFQNIKQFIEKQKEDARKDRKEKSVSLPPLNISINALKIKKNQILKRRLSTSQRFDKQLKKIQKQQSEADAMTKMFKKWSICQAISYQKQQMANAKNIQTKSINRYINKVIQSEEDKSVRVDQLIKSTLQIKEASQHSPDSRKNDRKIVENKLQNIILSAELAQQANLRSYMQGKYNMKTQKLTGSGNADSPKLSRSETNQSSLNEQILRVSSDLRATNNASKLSMISSITNKIHVKQGMKVDPFSFQGKLTKKLEELQDHLVQSNKSKQINRVNPEKGFIGNEIRKTAMKMKTEVSQDSPTNRAKTIKFENQLRIGKQSSQSVQLMTPAILAESTKKQKMTPSTTNEHSRHKSKTQSRYNTQQSQRINGSYAKYESGIKLRTQTSPRDRSQQAIQTLKKSQQFINSVVLPEIFSNKQKLMQKMKQKKSYIKMIQGHLHDSSLATLRNGQERKRIINHLFDMK